MGRLSGIKYNVVSASPHFLEGPEGERKGDVTEKQKVKS